MRYIISVLILIITAHTGAASKDAYQKIRPMIFQIKISANKNLGKNSYGTAFVVDKDGLLVTNYHVIADNIWRSNNSKIFAEINGQSIPAEIRGVDFINDLALLSVNYKFVQKIEIATQPPVQGQEIYSAGLPHDIGWVVTQGIYSGIIKQGPFELVHMSSSLNSGMSGGPTVNKFNQLIGVNVAKHSDAQQISFAVPAKYVKALIEKSRPKTKYTTDELLSQLKEQLLNLQIQMTEEIAIAYKNSKKVDGWNLPKFTQNLRCWGDSTDQQLNTPYISEGERCYVDRSVSLSEDNFTGSFLVENIIHENKKLTDIAWQNVREHHWNKAINGSSSFDSKSKINFGKPNCYRERIDWGDAQPRTISICLQKIIPLNGLYDASINLHVPLTEDKFIDSKIGLAGFDLKNIKRIIESVITHDYEGTKK